MTTAIEIINRHLDIIKAAREGDVKSLQELVTTEEDVIFINQLRPYNQTLLLESAHHNQFKVVEFLVSKGAKINHFNDANCSAYGYAYYNKNHQMMKFLLASGSIGEAIEDIEVDPTNEAHMVCVSANQLFKIARTGILPGFPITQILEKGAHFNQRAAFDKLNTPLHIACGLGHIDVMRSFCSILSNLPVEERNKILQAKNDDGYTILDYAALIHTQKNSPISQQMIYLIMDVLQPFVNGLTYSFKLIPRMSEVGEAGILHDIFEYNCEMTKNYSPLGLGAECIAKMFEKAINSEALSRLVQKTAKLIQEKIEGLEKKDKEKKEVKETKETKETKELKEIKEMKESKENLEMLQQYKKTFVFCKTTTRSKTDLLIPTYKSLSLS